MTPTTEAGKRLLAREAFNSRSFDLIRVEDITAIEAEARAAALDAVKAKVENYQRTKGSTYVGHADRIFAAVLRAIEEVNRGE